MAPVVCGSCSSLRAPARRARPSLSPRPRLLTRQPRASPPRHPRICARTATAAASRGTPPRRPALLLRVFQYSGGARPGSTAAAGAPGGGWALAGSGTNQVRATWYSCTQLYGQCCEFTKFKLVGTMRGAGRTANILYL